MFRPTSPLLYLQVTEKLLEAEEKKLRVLKTEVEASKHSDTGDNSKRVRVGGSRLGAISIQPVCMIRII